jgi:hypothetical protein
MKNITHFFLLLTFFIFGCRPDEISGPVTPADQTLYIPQEAKDYCYFQPGTYWVYQDSATGELDSVYVYEAGAGIDTVTATQSNPTEGVFEWLYCNKKSARDGYEYNSWIDMSWSLPDIDPRTKMFVSKTRPGDPVGEIPIIGFPINSNYGRFYGIWQSQTDTIDVNRLYNSTIILPDGFVCDSLIKVKHSYNPLSPFKATFYFSPRFGLVRTEQPDSARVWKLLRANIVQ